LILLILLIAGGVAGLWLAPANESAMPDQLDLGTVALNSRIELNARLLTSANLTPIELLHQKIDQKLPAAIRSYWKQVDPQQFRGTNQSVELNLLQPKVRASQFLRVSQVTPRQERLWYKGNPFLEVDFQLDTSRTGIFSGEIVGKLGRRRASFPVRYTVEDRSNLPRALVISPFAGDSTEHGTNFNTVVSVLSAASVRTDYLRSLPVELDAYQLVLLADSPLVNVTSAQAAELRQLLSRGGRLILACNYFYRGTVAGANRIAEGSGLVIVDDESLGKVQCSNITVDELTRGVQLLQMHRASPIQVSLAVAKPLVFGADGHCYAAVSRPVGGGELIVLTQSLWWNWVNEASGKNDNANFLRNLLSVGAGTSP
jgi:hypothetical protein